MFFFAMEDTERKWSSESQEADPHQTLNLHPLDLGVPSLQNCGEKIYAV